MPRGGKKSKGAGSQLQDAGKVLFAFGPAGGTFFNGTFEQLLVKLRKDTQTSAEDAVACLGASGMGGLNLRDKGGRAVASSVAVFQELYKLGLPEVVVAAMRKHKSSAGVQTACLHLLGNIFACSSGAMGTGRLQFGIFAPFAADGGFGLIVAALNRFADDAELQQAAMPPLTILGATHSGDQLMLQAGIIPAVIGAMRTHCKTADMLSVGANCLCNMINHSGALNEHAVRGAIQYTKHHVAEYGGLEAVVAGMRMHPLHLEVQRYSLDLLQMMAKNSLPMKARPSLIPSLCMHALTRVSP